MHTPLPAPCCGARPIPFCWRWDRRPRQARCGATPQLLSQSHASLVGLLGKEEALEIMMKNPAVLTCGANEIAASDPDEIRSAASVRKVLDGLSAETLTVGLVAALLLFVAKLAAAPH